MSQFYIIEIKKKNGEYEHEVSWVYDEDPVKARRKAEAEYYSKVSGACISESDTHAVTLIDDKGCPWLFTHYNHVEQATEEEPVEE